MLPTMTNSNQISAPRHDEQEENKEAIGQWIAQEGSSERSVAKIVAKIVEKAPDLLDNKSYHASRRIAERIRDAPLRSEGFVEVTKNRVRSGAAPKVYDVNQVKCGCKKKCGAKCRLKKHRVECEDATCRLGADCGNRHIQNNIAVNVVRRESEGMGFGVFAATKVPKRTYLCEYMGEVITEAELQARVNRHRASYVMDIGDGFVIDAFKYGSIGRFINHSCTPNAVAEVWNVGGNPRVAIYSNTTIEQDEEVTFDYGSDYEFMECKCPSCKAKETSHEAEALPAPRATSPHGEKSRLNVRTGRMMPRGTYSDLRCI